MYNPKFIWEKEKHLLRAKFTPSAVSLDNKPTLVTNPLYL